MKIHRRFLLSSSILFVLYALPGCAGQPIAASTFAPSSTATQTPTDTPAATVSTITQPPEASPSGTPTATRTWIPTTIPATADPFMPPLPDYALGRLGKGDVIGMDLSPDESRLAIASGIGIYLYEADAAAGTMREIWFRATDRRAVTVAFAPDGRSLAAGLQGWIMGDSSCQPKNEKGGLYLLAADSGEVLRALEIDMRGTPDDLAVSADNSTIGYIDAIGGEDAGYLWQAGEPEPEELPAYPDANVIDMGALTFSPDGNWAAYGIWKDAQPERILYAVWVMDLRTRQIRHQFESFGTVIRTSAFSPDSRRLAAGDGDGRIRVWDLGTGEETASAVIPGAEQIRFAGDGERIFVRTGTRIMLWDLTENRAAWSLPAHSRGISISLDGRRLLSYDEKALTVWDGETGKEIRDFTLADHEAVYDPEYSEDGREIVTATNLGNMTVWDASARRPLRTFNVSDGWFDFALAPDNRTMAVSRGDTVQIWDYRQGKPVRSLAMPEKMNPELAFSPDGTMLAASSGEEIFLFDIRTGETLMRQPSTGGAAFSPGGRMLTFLSPDSAQIILWNIPQGAAEGALEYDWPFGGSDFVFSPDGSYLGTAGFGQGVHWWSVADRRSMPDPGFDDSWPLMSLAFSPDGRTGAVGSYDILIWDFDIGQIQALGGHACWSTKVVYSPDGGVLASGSADGTVLLWDMAAVLGR